MTGNPKKKLCWNCEGRVSLEEENCPYCAVYLGPALGADSDSKTILAPPYRIVDSDENVSPPRSPYYQESSGEEEEHLEEVSVRGIKKDLFEVVLPLAMFSAGCLFFLFSLALHFFSNDGVFTLTWKSDKWYYYLFLSLPLLFLGWRGLQKFDREKEEAISSEEASEHTS